MKTKVEGARPPNKPAIGSVEVIVTKHVDFSESPLEIMDSLGEEDSADCGASKDSVSTNDEMDLLTVEQAFSHMSMDCVSENRFHDPTPSDERFMRCYSDTNMLDITNPHFGTNRRRVSLPLNQLGGKDWDRKARPRRSSLSPSEYQMPPPPQSTKKQLQSALYSIGLKKAPPRRRSSSTSPRVRLIEQLNTECEVMPRSDYDRTGFDSAYGRPDFPQIKEELVDFCENEMEVHPDARNTVYHEWLKPKGKTPNRKRRSSIQTAKVKGATNTTKQPSVTTSATAKPQAKVVL